MPSSIVKRIGASREDVIAASKESAATWRYESLAVRVRALRRLRKVITRRMQDIEDVVSREMRRPACEVVSDELGVTLNTLDFYIRQAPGYLEQRITSDWRQKLMLPFRSARVYRRPRGSGIVAIWPAWNNPFQLAVSDAAQALVCGHVVIMPMMRSVPRVSILLQEIVQEAGLSEVWHFVDGDIDTSKALIEALPYDSHVMFTGGAETGAKIATQCRSRQLHFHGEMGGSDVMMVLLDKEMPERLYRRAIGLAVNGRFRNAGQNCNAVKRVVVVGSWDDAYTFAQCVAARAESLRAGRDIGSLQNSVQFLSVVSKQERLAHASERPLTVPLDFDTHSSDNYIPPSVYWMGDVREQHNFVHQDEVFGPVLPILHAETVEDAMWAVNYPRFSLDAYIITPDLERGRTIGERLRVGSYAINDVLTNYAVPALPFGGESGGSGFGRRHGFAGLDQLTRPQSELVMHRWPRKEMHWFPYPESDSVPVRLMRFAIRYLFGE